MLFPLFGFENTSSLAMMVIPNAELSEASAADAIDDSQSIEDEMSNLLCGEFGMAISIEIVTAGSA
jgi:hypothetical protein